MLMLYLVYRAGASLTTCALCFHCGVVLDLIMTPFYLFLNSFKGLRQWHTGNDEN